MRARRPRLLLSAILILGSLATATWIVGYELEPGTGFLVEEAKARQTLFIAAASLVGFAGGLLLLGTTLQRAAREEPWHPQVIRVPREPSDRDTPWRQLDWDFDYADPEGFPLIRNEAGDWHSPWRDPWAAPRLRIKAHEALQARTEGQRFATYAGLVFLFAAGLLFTFFANVPPFYRQLPLIALVFSLSPLIRHCIALVRLRELRAGDLSGVGHSRDDVLFSFFLDRRGRRWSVVISGILVAFHFLPESESFLRLFGIEPGSGSPELPPMIAAWCVSAPEIRDGEPWRLLTGTLLHGHLPHLFFNVYALLVLGKIIEPILGPFRMILCYLGALFAGSFASFLLLPDGVPSVGASGAILGLLGVGIALELRARGTLPRNLRFGFFATLGLMSLLGLLGAGIIDNAGHAGGALGGALMALLITPRDYHRSRVREAIALALLLVWTALLFSAPGAAFFAKL